MKHGFQILSKGLRRMKHNKIVKIILLIAVMSMLFGTISFAGLTQTDTTHYTVDGELNLTDWYDPNDELGVEQNTLIMPEESTGDTRIISKLTAVADETYENMVTMKGKIKFIKFPKGEKVILAFGLDSIESYKEEPGNVEIWFQNKGNLTAQLVVYDENGDEVVVAPEKNCASGVNGAISVEATITSKAQLILKVNGAKVFDTPIPTSGEGRVGVLQTGGCMVELSEFLTTFMSYDRPENTDCVETFEEGIYNENLFTTAYYGSARSPACMAVEEYNGSNVLMFRNAGRCYFGTKQKYSNFEFKYDVPFYSRETVKDEEGNIILAPSSTLGISFGDVAQDFNGWQYTTSTDLVHFSQSSVWSYNHEPHLYHVAYSDMGFFDKESNEGYSVKITVIDGDFTLEMKALDAKDYKVVAKAHYNNFRTGYIKIWSTGDGNFAIDNFSLKNLDDNPNLVETPFESALIKVDDFNYVKSEMVFKEEKTDETAEEKPAFDGRIIVVGAAGLSVAMLGVAVLIKFVGNKRRKGGDDNVV